MLFPSPGEMDSFSKPQCRVLLEMDMDRPQGKGEEEICACMYSVAYFLFLLQVE